MRVTEYPALMYLPNPKRPRSLGVHASGIIRCIAVEMGVLKPEFCEDLDLYDAKDITDPDAIIRISIGLAWEEWYITNMLAPQGVRKHPPELRLDNVAMSPDGVQMTQGQLIIHEVKATYKSLKTITPIDKQWMWMTQIKAYCKAAKTLHARIHVILMCGDYKFPLKPKVLSWDLEFSQKELDENWQMMLEYKEWKE